MSMSQCTMQMAMWWRMKPRRNWLCVATGQYSTSCSRSATSCSHLGSIQDYLHVADYNIALIVTQCAAERIGRNTTLTKPLERSSLGDDNFKMLVWLSYNSPPIHEVDCFEFVRAWEKGKHQIALFKSGGTQRVLERKMSEHKHTILCVQGDR